MLKNRQGRVILAAIFLWVLYFLSSFVLKSYNKEYAGYLYFYGQVLLDLYISFLFFRISADNIGFYRIVLSLFGIAFLISAISDGIYNYLINIQENMVVKSLEYLYETPFSLFLLMSAIGSWCVLYSGVIKGRKIIIKESPGLILLLLAISIVFLSFLSMPWEIGYFSEAGIYQVLDTFLEAIIFSSSIIILVLSRKIYISLIASGFLAVCTADLIIRVNFIQGSILKESNLESFWVLGLALIATGLVLKKKNLTIAE